MRSRANLPVFVAYVLLGLRAPAFLAVQMGGEFVCGGYRVDAIFKSGAELVAGDDVSMSGLRVGKVETLTPMSGATRVTMLLHHDFTPVFKDARAVIRQKNLLGETYVELNRGNRAEGAIADGGTISQDHTLTPVEVDEVLNALDPQVRDQLAIVINTLGQGTAMMDNTNHYLNGAAVVFGVVQENTPGIQQLFRELASVMSGIGIPMSRAAIRTIGCTCGASTAPNNASSQEHRDGAPHLRQ